MCYVYYLLCVQCNASFMLYVLYCCSVVSLLKPTHSLQIICYHLVIVVSLSEPHTSESDGTSVTVVAFTNKYVQNLQLLLYRCNCHALYKAGTCVMVIHHMKNYKSYLLKAATCVTVVHHTKNYQSSLLRLHGD